jgi:hypothetical protein
MSASVAGADEELIEVPEVPTIPRDALEVMGVSAWSMKVRIAAGSNSILKLYAKKKADAPIMLVEGPVIRNDEGKAAVERRVVVTVDGLLVQPRQDNLKVGVGVFDPVSGTSTQVVKNPMPGDLLWIVEKLGFSMDNKGRIVLAKGHEESVTAVPMVNDEEYTFYLSVEPWKPE